MNEDLKNIIKEIECYKNEELCLILLSRKESNALIDYITNLQTKNEYLETWNSEIKLQLDNLQQENEDNSRCIKSLKEQLESVINENQRLLKQWFEDNDKAVKLVSEKEYYKSNYNDYKSRCEKAIEYIKENIADIDFVKENYNIENFNDFDISIKNVEDLLNILQNGSDDNDNS